jgi:hypothetical protein
MKSSFRYISLVYVAGMLMLGSCKKKPIDPPPGSTVPVFVMEAALDGEFFELEAGKNDAFMNTFKSKVNEVDLFSGRLGTDDLYVEMGIFNGDIDLPKTLSLKNFQGKLMFASSSSSPLMQLLKSDFPNSQMIQQVKWYVNGELIGLDNAAIYEPGIYAICALVTFIDQTQTQLCNEIIVGYNTNAQCSMHYFVSAGGHLKVWMDNSTIPIDHVTWKLDGEVLGDLSMINSNVTPDLHHIEAEVHYSNGVVRKKSMVVDGANQGRIIYDFSSLEQTTICPVKWDYSIVLKVKKEGKMYSSLYAPNFESSVLITDLNYFGQNAQGKSVYKCRAEISAMLAEQGSTDYKPFTCTTIFGIEVP